MLQRLEAVLLTERPDCVIVHGDTNSTLAGALAACKLGIPLAHVEAGLRSFNRSMPEEHNRVLTDHCSDLLFCPTATAVRNLEREGITSGVHAVGDVMYDSVLHFVERSRERSTIVRDLGLHPGGYVLVTIHRAYNADDPTVLHGLLGALEGLDEPVVFPVHPRTRQRMQALNRPESGRIRFIEPVGYLDMLALEAHARVVATDSGGMQKEAFFLGVPCVTLRPETEWVETVESGWNVLAGTDSGRIAGAIRAAAAPATTNHRVFGDGHAAERIVSVIELAAPGSSPAPQATAAELEKGR
jgi:UDP-N-acetylglucosamine 2-epimerase